MQFSTTYSKCGLCLDSGEEICLRHNHSKTASFYDLCSFKILSAQVQNLHNVQLLLLFTCMPKFFICFLQMFHTGYLPFTLLPIRFSNLLRYSCGEKSIVMIKCDTMGNFAIAYECVSVDSPR